MAELSSVCGVEAGWIVDLILIIVLLLLLLPIFKEASSAKMAIWTACVASN